MHFGLASSEYSNYSNKRRIWRCGAYLRKTLISIWIPKGAALIRAMHLFEARSLLEEIPYVRIHLKIIP